VALREDSQVLMDVRTIIMDGHLSKIVPNLTPLSEPRWPIQAAHLPRRGEVLSVNVKLAFVT
jgi:hypothetical protein